MNSQKITKCITVIVLLSFSMACVSGSKFTLLPMDEEQKQHVLQKFMGYDAKQKSVENADVTKNNSLGAEEFVLCENIEDKDCKASRLEHEKQQELRKNIVSNQSLGKYRVSVSYINDNSFTKKYNNFSPIEEMAVADATEYESQVYVHYLGNNYEPFQPELSLVTGKTVVIYFYATPSELQYFSSDKRITGISTPIDRDVASFPD